MAIVKTVYTLLIFVILFLGTMYISGDTLVLSGITQEYPIAITGNYTILEADFELVNISIFNYVYIALDTLDKGAGYSYGVIIIYDPDENTPTLYLMAGSGNSWYRIMNVGIKDNVRFSILIDHNDKAIYYIVNGKLGNINKSMIVMPEGVSIILDSIGREYPPPSINLKKLIVLETNDTHVIDYFLKVDFNKIYETSIIRLNKTKIGIMPTQSPTTSSPTTSPSPTTTQSPTQSPTYLSPTIVALIITISSITVIIAILIITLSQRKRSPGP